MVNVNASDAQMTDQLPPLAEALHEQREWLRVTLGSIGD
jgi:hypothetical protein